LNLSISETFSIVRIARAGYALQFSEQMMG
jgi:hypothetical protein